jgi:hypothetical protein
MSPVLSAADRALAQRLEAAEAANALTLMRASSSGVVEPFFGGVAMFGGAGSPITHSMGIGMNGPVSEAEFDRMEEFYRSRGSPCLIDLCPSADPTLIRLIQSRPYRVIEFNNVVARKIEPGETFDARADLSIIEAQAERHGEWAKLVAQAFAEEMPMTESVIESLREVVGTSRCLLGEESGRTVAGSAMGIQAETALFYGDGTLAEARGRGWQSAMIHRRLQIAQQAGCTMAMATVLPASGSHRNYERAGFQLIYMRVNLSRDWSKDFRDFGEQIIRADRLGNVSIHSRGKTALAIAFHCMCRQTDNRGVTAAASFALANQPRGGDSVDLGHLNVHQDQVVFRRLRRLHYRASGIDNVDCVTLFLQ